MVTERAPAPENPSPSHPAVDRHEVARAALDQLRPSGANGALDEPGPPRDSHGIREGAAVLRALVGTFDIGRLRVVVAGVLVGVAAALGGWFAAGWFGDHGAPSSGPVEHSLPLSPRVTGSAGPASGATGGTVAGPSPVGPGGTVEAPVSAHAAGAVVAPGVYTLVPRARVADLVRAAGGFAPDADADRVNLAAPVRDGMRLYVPRRGEAHVPPVVTGDDPTPGSGSGGAGGNSGGSGGQPGPDGRVDINRASVAELDALPGIGPTIATAIVDYRTRNGPFRSVDDLRKVHGIGEAKLRDLRDKVTVGG